MLKIGHLSPFFIKRRLRVGFWPNLDLQFFHCLDDVYYVNFFGLAELQSFFIFFTNFTIIFFLKLYSSRDYFEIKHNKN